MYDYCKLERSTCWATDLVEFHRFLPIISDATDFRPRWQKTESGRKKEERIRNSNDELHKRLISLSRERLIQRASIVSRPWTKNWPICSRNARQASLVWASATLRLPFQRKFPGTSRARVVRASRSCNSYGPIMSYVTFSVLVRTYQTRTHCNTHTHGEYTIVHKYLDGRRDSTRRSLFLSVSSSNSLN